MSYDSVERSNYDSVPTTLYEFVLGDAPPWRFATGENDVPFAGAVYTATQISDSGIVQSGETQSDDFRITLPSNLEFTQLFIGTPPSEQIFVTVRRMNRGETDAPVVWAGTVKSTKRGKEALSREIICATLTSSLNRNGLRLAWGRGCPHALYDRGCKVDPNAFSMTVQILSFDGVQIVFELGATPTGYFSGGYLEFQQTVAGVSVTDRRAIESQSGNRVSLLGPADGLNPGTWVSLYPGCDRISSTCELKFNNLSNYGGFPHLPNKSPFDGDPVF